MPVPTASVRAVQRYLSRLSSKDQKEVLQWLQDLLLVRDLPDPREIRETRYAAGVRCPHCRTNRVHRWGRYRGRQRYRCRGCHRTFNDLTGTPMHWSHRSKEWLLAARYMAEGLSLRQTARRMRAMHGCHVHYVTLFHWRHKLLKPLAEAQAPQLSGIVECDEMFVRESHKGKQLTHRLPWSKQPPPRGISRHQVCILTARDRNRRTIARAVGYGRLRPEWLQPCLAPMLTPGATLVTDGESAYRWVPARCQVNHEVLSNYKEVNGILHLQNINAYHSRLRRFLKRFRGVGTRYLDNYLSWFNHYDTAQAADMHAEGRRLLVASAAVA